MKLLSTLACAFVLWQLPSGPPESVYKPLGTFVTLAECEKYADPVEVPGKTLSFKMPGKTFYFLCLPGTLNPNHS